MSLVCIARGSFCLVFLPRRFPRVHLAGVVLGLEASKREGTCRWEREGDEKDIQNL